jgi:hypothetical protein
MIVWLYLCLIRFVGENVEDNKQYNDQEDKQWSTKHYTDKYRSSNTNNTKYI